MPVRTRFAPSPTGYLHLGHVLAAKIAHDLARSEPGGQFFLRHEDIDHSRVRPEYEQAIEDDLRWLGYPWDKPILRQSERTAAYDAALENLKHRGLAYPCFCSRKEIQAEWVAMAAAPHDRGEPPYPGTCRLLTQAERAQKLASGLAHSWRLDARAAAPLCRGLSFHDLRHGTHTIYPSHIDDVVLARKDIGTAYHLAVVIDDAFQAITHVTRGEDLLPSTSIHRVLQHLLGFPEPMYLHHRLVLDNQGRRLAKRHDALSLRQLRAEGKSPDDIQAMLEPWTSS
jgi:glutamyl-Q tRNA(Asp) synthetase